MEGVDQCMIVTTFDPWTRNDEEARLIGFIRKILYNLDMNKNKFETDMELKDYKVRFNTLVDKYKLNNLQSGTVVHILTNGEVLGHFTEEHNDTLQQHVDLLKRLRKWKVYPIQRGEMMRSLETQ